jgi:hypothetical protein
MIALHLGRLVDAHAQVFPHGKPGDGSGRHLHECPGARIPGGPCAAVAEPKTPKAPQFDSVPLLQRFRNALEEQRHDPIRVVPGELQGGRELAHEFGLRHRRTSPARGDHPCVPDHEQKQRWGAYARRARLSSLLRGCASSARPPAAGGQRGAPALSSAALGDSAPNPWEDIEQRGGARRLLECIRTRRLGERQAQGPCCVSHAVNLRMDKTGQDCATI